MRYPQTTVPYETHMKLLLVITGAIFALAGCAGSPYAESLKFDRLRNFSGPEYGYVVSSVGKDKSASIFDATEVLFRLRGTNDHGSFTYAPKAFFGANGASPRDIASADVEATTVVKRLPPGQYDVYVAKGIWNAGGTHIFYRPLNPPLSFTVALGKVTYAGRYVIGQQGYGPASSATLTISDEHTVDLARAKSRIEPLNIDEATFVSVPASY